MTNEELIRQWAGEAWKVVEKRMAAAKRIAAECDVGTAAAYDRLVLEELRGRYDAPARALSEFVNDMQRGGAL